MRTQVPCYPDGAYLETGVLSPIVQDLENHYGSPSRCYVDHDTGIMDVEFDTEDAGTLVQQVSIENIGNGSVNSGSGNGAGSGKGNGNTTITQTPSAIPSTTKKVCECTDSSNSAWLIFLVGVAVGYAMNRRN